MDLVYGVGPVLEALRAGRRRVHRIWRMEGKGADPRRAELDALAASAGVPLLRGDRHELARRVPGGGHQGVLAEAEPLPRPTLTSLLGSQGSRGGEAGPPPALVVALDGVQDPHNLGAVLRTAEGAGALAVVVPRDRSASLTPAAVKVAEGAAEYLPVVEVTNLRRALDEMKEAGLWAVGLAAGAGREWTEADLAGPSVVVLGSEGSGIRRLIREACDMMVAIPLLGKSQSLNVAAAAAVVLYEAVRQRCRGRTG